MSRQLRLSLEHEPSYERETFVVSPSNAAAVLAVDAWPHWHAGALALVGPPGAGKTHLARIWARTAGAMELTPQARLEDIGGVAGRPILLEGAEAADEEVLFHLINMATEPGASLLLTASRPPAAWTARLPDLRSRLNALQAAELHPPDDALLEGVLRKFFRERNIRPPEDVFSYLVRRMERSVLVALALVERLDEASLAEHRPVSRALARQILEEGGETAELFATRLAEPGASGENTA